MTTSDPLDALADKVAGKLASRFSKSHPKPEADLEDALMRAVNADQDAKLFPSIEIDARPATGFADVLNDPNLEARLSGFLNQ